MADTRESHEPVPNDVIAVLRQPPGSNIGTTRREMKTVHVAKILERVTTDIETRVRYNRAQENMTMRPKVRQRLVDITFFGAGFAKPQPVRAVQKILTEEEHVIMGTMSFRPVLTDSEVAEFITRPPNLAEERLEIRLLELLRRRVFVRQRGETGLLVLCGLVEASD